MFLHYVDVKAEISETNMWKPGQIKPKLYIFFVDLVSFLKKQMLVCGWTVKFLK